MYMYTHSYSVSHTKGMSWTISIRTYNYKTLHKQHNLIEKITTWRNPTCIPLNGTVPALETKFKWSQGKDYLKKTNNLELWGQFSGLSLCAEVRHGIKRQYVMGNFHQKCVS